MAKIELNFEIDTQSSYKWRPDYLPLYRGLVKKKQTEELDKNEREILRWLAFSLADYTLRS